MYARVHNNVVVEICTPINGFSIEECFHPTLVDQMMIAPTGCQTGWVLHNGSLFDPVDLETAQQITALTQDQIKALTDAEINGWNTTQVAGLTAAQLAEMTVAQLGSFTYASAQSLTTAQKANLTADQSAALSAIANPILPPTPTQGA